MGNDRRRRAYAIASRSKTKWRTLLQEVVAKHDPTLLPLIEQVGIEPLTRIQREALRSAVAAEFCLEGLREDKEPNSYGIELDDLITILGKY